LREIPFIAACLLFLGPLLAGCSQSPTFRLNTEGRDPQGIAPAQAEAVGGTLEELFGTPDEPRVACGAGDSAAAGKVSYAACTTTGLRIELLRAAAGPVAGDAAGKQRGLYRRHCVTCHGICGDGDGPTAAVLFPYPRDFRRGVFKYTSTAAGAKPARDDLRRTLRCGIPGAAMPSFAALADEEIEALVEYVQYLSIRGQTELYVTAQVLDQQGPLSLDGGAVWQEGVLPAARSWAEAEKLVVVPPAPPACDTPRRLAVSIARGRELFTRPELHCVDCHGRDSRGDGLRSGTMYDDWNLPKLAATPQRRAELARRFRLPLQRLPPRDLSQGVLHGGDRPRDIYWRIAVGIKGTPMPACGPAPGGKAALSLTEIWHVVNYIRSLSQTANEPQRREDAK
jgi:mono/diheme cytochrome c family protein